MGIAVLEWKSLHRLVGAGDRVLVADYADCWGGWVAACVDAGGE